MVTASPRIRVYGEWVGVGWALPAQPRTTPVVNKVSQTPMRWGDHRLFGTHKGVWGCLPDTRMALPDFEASTTKCRHSRTGADFLLGLDIASGYECGDPEGAGGLDVFFRCRFVSCGAWCAVALLRPLLSRAIPLVTTAATPPPTPGQQVDLKIGGWPPDGPQSVGAYVGAHVMFGPQVAYEDCLVEPRWIASRTTHGLRINSGTAAVPLTTHRYRASPQLSGRCRGAASGGMHG